MLDQKKAQWAASGRRETARLVALAFAAFIIGGFFLTSHSCHEQESEKIPATVAPALPPDAPAPQTVDRAKVRAPGDGEAIRQDASYEHGALDYVLGMTRVPLGDQPTMIQAKALDAMPFDEAAGRVFEVRGKVVDSSTEEFREGNQRLWSLVIEGKDGVRFVVLKHGLASDPNGGQPRSGTGGWIEEGDLVAVRAIYLQKRTGTVGKTALPGPVPVLVALAWRKTPPESPVVEDPSKADWDKVKDRFLADTKRWEEPALFETMQWAKEKGPKAIREEIRSGKLPWKEWNRASFDSWSDEIQVRSETQARPFTDGARGKLWRLSGLIGEFVQEGWDSIPPNEWGVDGLYILDLPADDYSILNTAIALRLFVPFPLDAFPNVEGVKAERVNVYGYFVKNFTYTTRHHKPGGGSLADATVPCFVVVFIEPYPKPPESPVLWYLAASMVVLGFLFYWVLVRGESREAKRTDQHRLAIRRRVRGAPGSAGEPPPPPPDAGGGSAPGSTG